MTSFMDPYQPVSDPWRSGLQGARAHLRVCLALQAASLALVLAYYHWEPARSALDRLMEVKLSMGFGFAILSTAFFGGILPYAYLHYEGLKRLGRPRYDGRQGLGLVAFWAYKGFEVDLFYRILARVIGPGHDALTIFKKACTDQLFYGPLYAVPMTVAAYQLIDAHGSFRSVWEDWRAPRWLWRRIVPILISNAAVWMPAVAIIYSLPTPLQLPLQNLVLCFYTLLVAHQLYLEPNAGPGTFGGACPS